MLATPLQVDKEVKPCYFTDAWHMVGFCVVKIYVRIAQQICKQVKRVKHV